jgi:hypothetical protein
VDACNFETWRRRHAHGRIVLMQPIHPSGLTRSSRRGAPLLAMLLAFALGAAGAPSTGDLVTLEVAGAFVHAGEIHLFSREAPEFHRLVEWGSVAGEGPLVAAPLALPAPLNVEALRGAAPDGALSVFLIAAFARTDRDATPERRYRLARLQFGPDSSVTEARGTDALLHAVVRQFPFLADAMRRTPARSGLQVGGLAWTPEGHLLVGLRSPTVTESRPRAHGGQEDAVLFRLENPHGIFDGEEPVLAPAEKIDLQGQGIRGLAYDAGRGGWWVLSGLSPEPTHPVRAPWWLWFWDGKTAPRQARLPAECTLDDPGGLALLPDGRLLLTQGARPHSRYLLFTPTIAQPTHPREVPTPH